MTNTPIAEAAIKQLFTEARTHRAWTNRQVSDETLREIYELVKWAPTSANCLPVRILYIKSASQKEKLLPALYGSNPDQVKAAPVTAIVAYDLKFYDQLPTLFPHMDFRSMFVDNPELARHGALQSGSLQGGYFMLAARALGLDVGPMGGFDANKVNETFLQGTSWEANFLCNLGYGDSSKLFPRDPRLDFHFSCRMI
jgi:3-hydroxypropanoate dehydrogenase